MIMGISVLPLEMGAPGSMSLAMSSAQVLADEIPLTSRKVTEVYLFGRIYEDGQPHGEFSNAIKELTIQLMPI